MAKRNLFGAKKKHIARTRERIVRGTARQRGEHKYTLARSQRIQTLDDLDTFMANQRARLNGKLAAMERRLEEKRGNDGEMIHPDTVAACPRGDDMEIVYER